MYFIKVISILGENLKLIIKIYYISYCKGTSMPSTKTTTHNGNKLEWSKGTGNKKYRVVVYYKNGTKKTIQFGDNRYEQFKDSSPLKLYTSKNHGDKARRSNYIKRHTAQGYHKKIYSPSWFSLKYLW